MSTFASLWPLHLPKLQHCQEWVKHPKLTNQHLGKSHISVLMSVFRGDQQFFSPFLHQTGSFHHSEVSRNQCFACKMLSLKHYRRAAEKGFIIILHALITFIKCQLRQAIFKPYHRFCSYINLTQILFFSTYTGLS